MSGLFLWSAQPRRCHRKKAKRNKEKGGKKGKKKKRKQSQLLVARPFRARHTVDPLPNDRPRRSSAPKTGAAGTQLVARLGGLDDGGAIRRLFLPFPHRRRAGCLMSRESKTRLTALRNPIKERAASYTRCCSRRVAAVRGFDAHAEGMERETERSVSAPARGWRIRGVLVLCGGHRGAGMRDYRRDGRWRTLSLAPRCHRRSAVDKSKGRETRFGTARYEIMGSESCLTQARYVWLYVP